jgi:hypothetical protein
VKSDGLGEANVSLNGKIEMIQELTQGMQVRLVPECICRSKLVGEGLH